MSFGTRSSSSGSTLDKLDHEKHGAPPGAQSRQALRRDLDAKTIAATIADTVSVGRAIAIAAFLWQEAEARDPELVAQVRAAAAAEIAEAEEARIRDEAAVTKA